MPINNKDPDDGFINILQHQRDGALEAELNKMVKDAIQSIQKNKGTAVLKLELKFGLLKGYDAVITINDKPTIKLPEKERHPQLAFATNKGVVFEKPDQADLVQQLEESTPLKRDLPVADRANIRSL